MTGPSSSPADIIRTAAAVLSATGDRELIWLARGFARFVEGDEPDFETAVGLRAEPGERGWRERDRLAQRDLLICELRRRFYADLLETPAAVQISRTALRYETARWRVDHDLTEPPDAYRGTELELLFAVMKLGGIPSARQVRRILATSSRCSWPTDREKIDAGTTEGHSMSNIYGPAVDDQFNGAFADQDDRPVAAPASTMAATWGRLIGEINARVEARIAAEAGRRNRG